MTNRSTSIAPRQTVPAARVALPEFIRALNDAATVMAAAGNERGAALLWAASEHCVQLADIAERNTW